MPAKPRARAAGRSVRPMRTESPRRGVEFTPLRLTTTPDAEREPVDRVPLFYLDGVGYTIPSQLPFNLALKIMRTTRHEGLDAAVVELLEEALGEEAFTALANYRDLKAKHLMDLFVAVRQVVMGGMEGPKVISNVG